MSQLLYKSCPDEASALLSRTVRSFPPQPLTPTPPNNNLVNPKTHPLNPYTLNPKPFTGAREAGGGREVAGGHARVFPQPLHPRVQGPPNPYTMKPYSYTFTLT
jgi:hypothetical protein